MIVIFSTFIWSKELISIISPEEGVVQDIAEKFSYILQNPEKHGTSVEKMLHSPHFNGKTPLPQIFGRKMFIKLKTVKYLGRPIVITGAEITFIYPDGTKNIHITPIL